MDADPAVRIKYASKYAGVSNYWKKWIGENRGLKRLNALKKKQEFEKKITKWINQKPERKQMYGNILQEYKNIYNELTNSQLAYEYFYESIYKSDIMKLASNCDKILLSDKNNKSEDEKIKSFKGYLKGFYKDFYLALDKEVFTEMIRLYYKNVPKNYFCDALSSLETKFKGNAKEYVDNLYAQSVLPYEEKLDSLLNNYSKESIEILKNDPLIILNQSFIYTYLNQLLPKLEKAESSLQKLNRIWMQAIMKFEKDKVLYPDANFTLRVAYGKVDDYYPRDGVKYLYYTTLDGIMEKDNPEIYDYRVPEKLKELFAKKDYGQYGEDDKMHVCFTASNHTTGGNSGSPVVNGEGNLIGINFDRNWEGTMSDIMYDPDMCRNITVDIRYVLFIIDKFAGAKHLIKEMRIIK